MSLNRLRINTYVSLLNRLVAFLSSFILPRLIIQHYGSDVNGLVLSITQFLNIITFLDLGVGSVIQFNLYKPLTNKDDERLSKVVRAAKSFFRKISLLIVIYVIILIFYYPNIVTGNLDGLSTALLIISVAIGLFGQYYFGIVNELILNADRKSYVQNISEAVTVLLNLLISVIVVKAGYSVIVFKLLGSLIFLLRPIFLSYYVKENYAINPNIKVDKDPLPERWDGMAQHIAYTVQNSIDVIALSFFMPLEIISIYSIYSMIINAIKSILSTFIVELKSFIGNLYIKDSISEYSKKVTFFEWGIHILTSFVFSLGCVLIIPFVSIYTQDISKIDYVLPVFAFIYPVAHSLVGIKSYYQSIIFSAGHYKETRNNAFIEAILNVVITISLIKIIGISALAVGTLVAMLFRIGYLIDYLSRAIIFRKKGVFLKQIFITALSIIFNFILGSILLSIYPVNTITEWIIAAMILSIIFIITIIVINIPFYFKNLKLVASYLFKKVINIIG